MNTHKEFLEAVLKFVLETTPKKFEIEDVLKRVEVVYSSITINSSNTNS